MATPSVLYQTTQLTALLADGQPKLRFPLPPECTIQFSALAFEQDYSQRLDSFPPAPKNTPSTVSPFALSNANAILTGFSQPQNIGALAGKFAATFAVVPATWSDVKQLPFTFPGFPGMIGQTGSRDIFTDRVDTRIQYDYFVIDPGHIISAVADGTPATATTLKDSGGTAVNCVYKITDIPLVTKSIFCVALSGTPDYTNRTQSLIVAGGASIGGLSWYQTWPTKGHYQSWMANATTNGWASTVWPGNVDSASAYGQLVVEDSNIQPYLGNIVCRVTMYVLAK